MSLGTAVLVLGLARGAPGQALAAPACAVTGTAPASGAYATVSPVFSWTGSCRQYRLLLSPSGAFGADTVATSWTNGATFQYAQATWDAYRLGAFAAGTWWKVQGWSAGQPRAFSTPWFVNANHDLPLSSATAKVVGTAGSDVLGTAVAGAGDQDGDGVPDLLVGAPGAGVHGQAYVLPGHITGQVTPSAAIATVIGSACCSVGVAVAGGGDANGDGHLDLLVSDTSSRRTFLELGPVLGTKPTNHSDAVLSGPNYGIAGWSIAFAGDLDADGDDEILVGDPGDPWVNWVNRAYLVASPVAGSVQLATAATATVQEVYDYWTEVGYSVSSAGDVDADGTDDVLVGVPNSLGSYGWYYEDGAGAIGLYYGPMSGIYDPYAGHATFTGTYQELAGRSVAPAGDIDGDGYDDFLIGAEWSNWGTTFGAVYVVYGGSTRYAGTIPLSTAGGILTGVDPGGLDRVQVAGAGDVNGDGYGDVLIGAPYLSADPTQLIPGLVYVVYGPVYGTRSLGLADVRITAEAAMDGAGMSVASVGDVDGDGRDDILIGAPDQDAGGPNAGAAYLVAGALL